MIIKSKESGNMEESDIRPGMIPQEGRSWFVWMNTCIIARVKENLECIDRRFSGIK